MNEKRLTWLRPYPQTHTLEPATKDWHSPTLWSSYPWELSGNMWDTETAVEGKMNWCRLQQNGQTDPYTAQFVIDFWDWAYQQLQADKIREHIIRGL